jgi:hypothetical protein
MKRKFVTILFVLLLASCQSGPLALFGPTPTPFPVKFEGKAQVGDYTMPIECAGSGEPTIILDEDAYYGGWYSTSVNKFRNISRTCVYGKVGKLYYDQIKAARNTLDEVKELHVLLEKTGVPGPYILVGYVTSSYNLIQFTDLYPKEVAGLVCIACTYPTFYDYWMDEIMAASFKDASDKQLLIADITNYKDETPDEWDWDKNPMRLDKRASEAQVLQVKSLKDTPLLIVQISDVNYEYLNSAQSAFISRLINKSQEDFCRLTSNCEIMKVVESNDVNTIIYDQSVDEAIQKMFDKVKRP